MVNRPHDAPFILREKASSVHFLWGFLSVAFAAALVRGHLGAETSAGRVTVDVVFGLLLIGALAAWRFMRRHPAWLEISEESITLAHKGAKTSERMLRSSGDLYIRMAGGRYPRPYLMITNEDTAFLLTTFDQKMLIRACLEKGWHFLDRLPT